MTTAGYIDSYYTRTLAGNVKRPVLQQNIETDVCVIGGGLAGLATALGLLERGKRVVVLESKRIGWAASGRNGGFVLAGFATSPDNIAKRTGWGTAKKLFDLTRDAQTLIRKRIKDYNIPCDPTDGHLVISWYDDPDAIRKKQEFMQNELNVPAEFWPREKVREVCRSEHYYDALFLPDYFHMHSLNYVLGLAQAVENRGGKIFEESEAHSLIEDDSHTIYTATGSVKAQHIVYCGSAYFNGLEKKVQRSCLPVSTYAMVTEPLTPKQLESTVRVPYCIRDTRWSDSYYRLLPDNSLLWGGLVGLGEQTPANLSDIMRADLLSVYPQLADLKMQVCWAGTMGYTVHKMPHIGKLRPGIWVCTNFGGNGVGPTTAGGEVIAAAIAEQDETYKLFEPFGYAWTGGVLGPYVAQAVYYSWGIRDSLHTLKYKLKARNQAA